MPDLTLLTFWCETRYRVDLRDDPADLWVGRHDPKFDAHVLSLGVSTWAYITAWNPCSQLLDPEVNDRRQQRLIESVREMRLRFDTGRGIGPDPDWLPEESLCLYGLDEQSAVVLAADFEQHAIVFGRAGLPAVLRFTIPAEWQSAVQAGLNTDNARLRRVCTELAERYAWRD